MRTLLHTNLLQCCQQLVAEKYADELTTQSNDEQQDHLPLRKKHWQVHCDIERQLEYCKLPFWDVNFTFINECHTLIISDWLSTHNRQYWPHSIHADITRQSNTSQDSKDGTPVPCFGNNTYLTHQLKHFYQPQQVCWTGSRYPTSRWSTLVDKTLQSGPLKT
jgi:hypothetical protein